MEAVFTLPRPPSINACYGNRRSGQKGRGRFVRPELARWRAAAAKEMQALGRYPCFASAVTVEICASEEGVSRADADNLCKATCDFLVEMGVIIDDSRKIVRKVSSAWGDGQPGMITVTVREVSPPECIVPRVKQIPRGKAWAVKQLKRRFGIDIHPDRIHL